jgi:gluconate 2-dehydrogenase alpha chain
MYHGFCNTGGCHVDAKNSTAVSTIPRAQATGNLKVVTRATVTSIDVDNQGRATGVTYVIDGIEYVQPARVVLLASYTYENVRLLLLSKSKAYPNGVSNNHNQVGRHYFSHHQGAPVSALFPFDIDAWYGLPAQGVAVDNWADDNFDHAGLDFIGGGNLWAMSDRRPITASAMNTFGYAPTWGSQWKAFIKQNADRSHNSYIQKTTLPYEDNFLDLDPTVKDPLGFPVIRITAEYKDNERKIAAFTQDKMEQWYREAGAIAIQRAPVGGAMGASTHAYGGTRMGDNPETNVVNRFGLSHEVENLGILGGSVMGTSGAHNPTHTVQALAWRTAEHVVTNWKSIARTT